MMWWRAFISNFIHYCLVSRSEETARRPPLPLNTTKNRRRSVKYEFVPHNLEGQPHDTFFGHPDALNVVEVSLSFQYECEVSIDGEFCSSCTYCGDYKYTTDCTNIPNGRKTSCESAEVDDFRNELLLSIDQLVGFGLDIWSQPNS